MRFAWSSTSDIIHAIIRWVVKVIHDGELSILYSPLPPSFLPLSISTLLRAEILAGSPWLPEVSEARLSVFVTQ